MVGLRQGRHSGALGHGRLVEVCIANTADYFNTRTHTTNLTVSVVQASQVWFVGLPVDASRVPLRRATLAVVPVQRFASAPDGREVAWQY